MSKSSPRVLIVTRYPRPWGIGPCYFRAFKRAGYETRIHFLFGMTADSLQSRLLRRLAIAYKMLIRNAVESLLREVRDFQPNLIVVWKGEEFRGPILEELKASSQALLFNIYTDSPLVEVGFPNLSKDSFHSMMRQYDCVFSFARFLVPVFYMCGASMVEYLPFACDPEIHYPTKAAAHEHERYSSQVAYLGNYPCHHERWLRLLIPFGFKIWGKDWWRLPADSALRRCWQKPGREGYGMGQSMAKVCSGSAVVFNIVRAEHGCAHSLKTFEIPACGGFMLSNRTDEQLEYFKEDRDAIYFSSEEELLDKMRFYLIRDNLRAKIANDGWQTAQVHTFDRRVGTILETYRQLRGSAPLY